MNEVNLVVPKSDPTIVRKENIYQYNSATAKWPWLQRVCFYILKKLKAEQLVIRHDYQYVEIDFDNLPKKIHEAMYVAHELGRRPTRLYVGCRQYSELIRTGQTYPTNFSFKVPETVDNFGGMVIEVVPWMDGVLPVVEDR